MEPVTVYAKNGATFTCDTKERLEGYLKAGWSKEKPTKRGEKAEKEEPPKNKEA